MSGQGTELVKRVDVAKFYQLEIDDIDRWISDGLSISKLPGEKRPSVRIYLPDLHQWLVENSMISDGLRRYEDFRRAFLGFRAARKSKEERSAA